MEELLKQVADGKVDYTVVQDTILARTQRYYPELTEGLTLASNQTVAWAMTKLPDDSLYASIIDFFGQRFMDGAIAKARREVLRPRANGRLRRHLHLPATAKSLLPKYQALFQTHANVDIDLAAAGRHQPSGIPLGLFQARSCHRVRGHDDAHRPDRQGDGVNRSAPTRKRASLAAPATCRMMMAKVPDSVPMDERKCGLPSPPTNIGYGH